MVVGVALDVAKAFPSGRVAVLVEESRKMGVGEEVVRFVDAFMRGRSCRLHFEGTISDPLDWESGLPQGSPLLTILFLIYNAALLLLCSTASSRAFGWINDLNLLAWGDTLEEAVAAAQELVPGLEMWSETHSPAFDSKGLAKDSLLSFRSPPPSLSRPLSSSSTTSLLYSPRSTLSLHLANTSAFASNKPSAPSTPPSPSPPLSYVGSQGTRILREMRRRMS